MFEITGTHISQLNDSDLRTLVARLCEAELAHRGLPVSSVTAGGDQNAADGGIDVRVDLPPTSVMDGFIPRPSTGFQVKVPNMPRGDILEEMCPKGTLRPVIAAIHTTSGAYIIVSSKGSTADKALQERRQAMHDATSSLPNPTQLLTDFFTNPGNDSWVLTYPCCKSITVIEVNQQLRRIG